MIRSKRLTAARQLAVAAASLLGAGALIGCGVAKSTPSTIFNPAPVLQGQAVAGRNYLANAKVTVYSTANTGSWNATSGNYVGTAKVLGTTTTNTVGAYSFSGLSCSSPDMVYVTVEGGRPFPPGSTTTASIDAGLPSNAKSLMMTAIGDCSLLSAVQVRLAVTNEASTVAAVEALQRFMSVSGTTVNVTSNSTNYAGNNGVGTATSRAGLRHAFDLANSLSNYGSGAFNQNTNGNDFNNGGIIPVQVLNALAYSQFLCTIGGPDKATAANYPYCTTLFQLATPPGGQAPTNTLQAMLNIARNPKNNTDALLAFSLTPIPFDTNAAVRSSGQLINDGVYVPALSSFGGLFSDFSIGIVYPKCYGSNPVVSGTVTTGYGSPIPTVSCAPPTTATAAAGVQTGLTYPLFLALDSNDNVFISNPSGGTSVYGTVIGLSNSGNILFSTSADATNGLTNPRAIAVDNANHVFVVNQGTGAASFIYEVSAANGAPVQKIVSAQSNNYGIAVDPLGNLFYGSNSTAGQIREASYNATTSSYVENALPVALSTPLATYQIALDANLDIWAEGSSASTTTTGSTFYYVPNTGSLTAPAYAAGVKVAVTTGGPTQGITVDAANNAYTLTSGTTAPLSNLYKATVTGSGAGAVVASSTVGAATVNSAQRSMMTDGSGLIWTVENATPTAANNPAGRLFSYDGTTGTATSYMPCYFPTTFLNSGNSTNTSQTCVSMFNAKIDLAIDSSGNIWVANATGGTVVEVIGVASPTVPNRSLQKIGIIP